jgi:hypothetical protein
VIAEHEVVVFPGGTGLQSALCLPDVVTLEGRYGLGGEGNLSPASGPTVTIARYSLGRASQSGNGSQAGLPVARIKYPPVAKCGIHLWP